MNTNDPVTATMDPAARDVARDAAVRALTVALEHHTPAPPDVLERVAASAVDAHLQAGNRPWVLLIEDDPDSEIDLAKAVLGTLPNNRSAPTTADLADARTVIRTLVRP